MEEPFYPPLPDRAVWTVDIILQNIQQDPEYLDYSPYTSEEITALRKWSSETTVELEEVEEVVGDDKWARLERESNSLFTALTAAGKDLQSADQAQKMAYFRTATSLLDKIVGIQERTANLKQIHKFHNTVLSVMEDVLEPGQRTAVLDRLKESINADV